MPVDKYFKAGAAFAAHAGTDITRPCATYDLGLIIEEWDDYSGLSDKQIDFVISWRQRLESQFVDQFYYVGNLVRDKC